MEDSNLNVEAVEESANNDSLASDYDIDYQASNNSEQINNSIEETTKEINDNIEDNNTLENQDVLENSNTVGNINDITADNIEQYFKNENIYQDIHNQLVQNDKNYQEIYKLLEDSNTLHNYLMQINSNFANSDDINVKSNIMYEAKNVLEQQIQNILSSNLNDYKVKISDYVVSEQFNKYLQDNVNNLEGINNLVNNLYDVITEKANLGRTDDSKLRVGNTLNNALFNLAKEFKIHPKELVDVIENYGNKKDVKAALNKLQNKTEIVQLAKERAKSITKGGTNANINYNNEEDLGLSFSID